MIRAAEVILLLIIAKRPKLHAIYKRQKKEVKMKHPQNSPTANMHAIKSKIICELENMVAARLFGRQPWQACGCIYRTTEGPSMEVIIQLDRQPQNRQNRHDADLRKLMQMGLVKRVRAEPETWQSTALGMELNVYLFEVFLGLWCEWEVLQILEEQGLLTESEFDAISESSDAELDSLLGEYVKRAYYVYRKVTKFLHSIAGNRSEG